MKRALIVLAMAAVAATGCSGSSSKSSGPGSTGPSLPTCPLSALDSAKKPVEITYWHALTRANKDEIQKLTDQFNASQSDVHVSLSAATSYTDNLTRFKAGLGTGKLPDLYQGEDTETQILADSQATLPVQACLNADHADTSDFVTRIAAYYSLRGALQGMPFNDSNIILYYNKALFEKAGLDPNKPPTTLDELEAAARKIVDSGAAKYGLAMKMDSWLIEHWLAKAGHTLVDNGNGRTARAQHVTFNDDIGLQLFSWIDKMVKAKLAESTGTADIDHYLAVGRGDAAMTMDSSAALGTIQQLFAAGEYRSVKLGVGAMPGPTSDQGGVLVGGAANYIMKSSAPEKQAAAYRFAKFLADAKTQAEWAAATGYVPVRKSSAGLEPLATKWAQHPEFKVAYDQLLAGAENDATAGPVIGAYGAKGQGVRGAIIDALNRMVTEHQAPAVVVPRAAQQADAAIAEYNSRVG
jgi:sn-glycerol 3-phosphate transport system substrate-binding protein